MNDAPEHPYPRAVEAFTDVMRLAQDGKVAAFAVLMVDPDGGVTWKWHLGPRLMTDIIGGLACLQWYITATAMNRPAPPAQPAPFPEPATPTPQ